MLEIIDRGERIRTSGPCLPKAVLYQAELHPVVIGIVWRLIITVGGEVCQTNQGIFIGGCLKGLD